MVTAWLLAGPVSYGADELCPYASLTSPQLRSVARSSWGAAKGDEGHFSVADPQRLQDIEAKYLRDLARPEGLNIALEGKPERFTREHLDVDFAGKSEAQLKEIREAGWKALAHGSPTVPPILKGTAYSGFSPLHYFTSGAGLWSRGGGTVKSLVPLNLRSLLSPAEFSELERAGNVVAAKGPAEAFKAAGVPIEGTPSAREGEVLAEKAKQTIHRLTEKAMADPRSLNVIDLKMANIALMSQRTGSYIHFDIWTSEQTHGPIREHMKRLRANYRTMEFHPDKGTNQDIHKALENYFAASERLGETHLFGYQVGVYPLDPITGKSIQNQVPIGEGAGMAKKYLDDSGRTALLESRGAKDWVFQNIEVTSDVALEYAAYQQSGKPVAAVLVPTQPGYAGGSPYLMRHQDGSLGKELLEGSAVSKDLRDGNAYFNSNTIYQSMSLKPPANVGYELKENGRIVRLKMNAGDVTMSYPSAMIGGRAKEEYENFKTYGEYGDNGAQTIETLRATWAQRYLGR